MCSRDCTAMERTTESTFTSPSLVSAIAFRMDSRLDITSSGFARARSWLSTL